MPDTYTCIIPVRYASTRFPGKPLVTIAGKTMLEWVYTHATTAKKISNVIIAAYDQEIEDYCRENALLYVRVSASCKNGSEAVADVAAQIGEQFIFEMQGDQPLVTPDVIDDFLTRAAHQYESNSDIDVVHPFTLASDEQIQSRDVVKVVKTKSNKLIFQTRHPIETGLRTLGLYLWKKESLFKFAKSPVSRIEKAEDSHPIRLYIEDMVVQGIEIDSEDWVEVDREHQVAEVERLMEEKGIV